MPDSLISMVYFIGKFSYLNFSTVFIAEKAYNTFDLHVLTSFSDTNIATAEIKQVYPQP